MRTALVALLALLLLGATTVVDGDIVVEPVEDDVITVLLLGADQGPPRSGSPLEARADAFHLLVVSADRQHATILNFPRDSYVPVANVGPSKINACLIGGPERCVATVESVFDTTVDAWFVTSMLGMAEAFAEFGGVVVDVETPVFDGGPDITATGPQRLKIGALTFARDRKNRPGGDFRRSEAQGELLIAAHERLVTEFGSLDGALRSLAILRRHSVTDATPEQLVKYAVIALGIPPRNVANVNVPGEVGTAGAASIVRLPPRAHALIQDVLRDGRLDG